MPVPHRKSIVRSRVPNTNAQARNSLACRASPSICTLVRFGWARRLPESMRHGGRHTVAISFYRLIGHGDSLHLEGNTTSTHLTQGLVLPGNSMAAFTRRSVAVDESSTLVLGFDRAVVRSTEHRRDPRSSSAPADSAKSIPMARCCVRCWRTLAPAHGPGQRRKPGPRSSSANCTADCSTMIAWAGLIFFERHSILHHCPAAGRCLPNASIHSSIVRRHRIC